MAKKVKSDLQVMIEMSKSNPDSVQVSTNITELKHTKKGTKITFEIDKAMGTKLMKQFGLGIITHYPMMIIPEKESFDKIKES